MEATLLKSDGAMDVPPAFVPGTYVTSASTVGSFYDGVPKGSQMTSSLYIATSGTPAATFKFGPYGSMPLSGITTPAE